MRDLKSKLLPKPCLKCGKYIYYENCKNMRSFFHTKYCKECSDPRLYFKNYYEDAWFNAKRSQTAKNKKMQKYNRRKIMNPYGQSFEVPQ